MRWDELFRDLEAQAEESDRAALAGEVADRARRELATVSLSDRFRAHVGQPVTVRLAGSLTVSGAVSEVGPDWVLLDETPAGSALVALEAVLTVSGGGSRAAAPGAAGVVAGRLALGVALRGLARDRAAVAVHLVDGSVVTGTIDRVGADFLDVTEHAPGEPRRREAVRGVRWVAFRALAAVRSRP
jgi:hypothetical protein